MKTAHWGHFARHYVEMVVAMVVGMVVLGGLQSGVVAVTGLELDYALARRPEFAAFEMAFTMSVGMVVWMRYRRHSWASTLEMVAAMFVPLIAFAILAWLDIIRSESLMMLTHVVMLPLMLDGHAAPPRGVRAMSGQTSAASWLRSPRIDGLKRRWPTALALVLATLTFDGGDSTPLCLGWPRRYCFCPWAT